MAEDETTRVIKHRQTFGADETIATTPIGTNEKKPYVEDDHTKIFKPSSATKQGGSSDSDTSLTEDPVVGWLVVVSGPGKGASLKLGFGMNPIGRAQEERVSLNFGDEEISRTGHAVLTYDPKGNKFYLQHGGGVNLTYLGDSPVLQASELKGREIISIGKTQLCFVPFCTSTFVW